MYKAIICTISIVSIVLLACNREKRGDERQILKYIGEELKLESNYYSYNSSCQKYDTVSLSENTFKLVSYYNADLCASCIDELQLWSPIVREFENDTTVEFLFIVKIDKYRFNHHIKPYIKSWGNNIRVCLDLDGMFEEKNDISDKHFFNTFLLNSNNKTVLVGNPLFSDDLILLYKNKLKSNITRD